MKRYLILLLLIANLGLGVQSFAVMTKDERIKLEDQIDEAYEKEDKEKLLLLITKYVKKKHLRNRKLCFSTGIDAAERIMKEM